MLDQAKLGRVVVLIKDLTATHKELNALTAILSDEEWAFIRPLCSEALSLTASVMLRLAGITVQ